MKPLALLLACLALPATAQVVPDEFPDASEPFADRAQRELVERHRPFLSGLFASSAVAVGPELGRPDVQTALAVEGGYRFDSGLAVALRSAVRRPLGLDALPDGSADALTAHLGGEVVLALGRGADRRSVLRGAEVGLGLGAEVFEATDGQTLVLPAVTATPRVAIPLSPTLAVPVGLHLSKEIGTDARPLFVGLSLGVRRIWADNARMVLE